MKIFKKKGLSRIELQLKLEKLEKEQRKLLDDIRMNLDGSKKRMVDELLATINDIRVIEKKWWQTEKRK